MYKQSSFTDMEYSQRRKITKREEFLNMMNSVVPWNAWIEIIKPYYPEGKKGRKPQDIERMLRMLLLQTWFNLSDEGIEDAIYDSYAMKQFLAINFNDGEQAPDATTLCKFRKLLNDNGLQQKLFADIGDRLSSQGKMMHGGTIVDATIIEASSSRKNAERKLDPEMHSVRKNTKWFFGMRAHIGADAGTGYVHHLSVTAANLAEIKVAPELLRIDDAVVYGDAGYLKMENYVKDGIERDYRINRQMGTFNRHYGNGLSYQMEKQFERRKSSVRWKVEYVFHIVKDIFKWRRARYKGLAKNTGHANLLFASANLYMCALSGGF
jgi:IS5 family transposase